MRNSACPALLSLALLAAHASSAAAQTPAPTAVPEISSQVLVGEGIYGDVDKYRRSPQVSVGIVHGVSVVSLRADASILDSDYEKYPIQFSFFVNRKLYSTQIRSKGLPGAVGIDIPNELAAPPFNYTIIATMLHPNRQFTTMIEGAVFGNNLVATLDCTLTLPAQSEGTAGAGDTAEIFTESNVTTSQSGENVFSVSFEDASDASGSKTASLDTTVTVNVTDNSAAGTLVVDREGEESSVAATGKITVTAGNLSALTLTSADGNSVLSCS